MISGPDAKILLVAMFFFLISTTLIGILLFLCLMNGLARWHVGWFSFFSNWRVLVPIHSRRKRFSVSPPLVYMAVTIDAGILVFDCLVANHNKLTRTEVTTTVCRKVDWRIFSAYPLKWIVIFSRGMEGSLQIDVYWCVQMSVSDIFLFDVQGIISRLFGIVVKAPLL